MKKIVWGGLAAAAVLWASGAQAQMFTYEVTWGEVEMRGGIGPDGSLYRGGSVDGTYVTTYANGETATGTISCVGQDQTPGSMFYFHMACDATSEDSTVGIGYGCNYVGEPGPETPVSCVGGMHGRDGEAEGRNGNLTMFWYSQTQARGTGQWFQP